MHFRGINRVIPLYRYTVLPQKAFSFMTDFHPIHTLYI